LFEIAKSKITYCSFTDKSDAYYDIILPSIDLIPENVEQSRQNRADRLSKLAYDEAIVSAKTAGIAKPKAEDYQINPATILDSEIVYRISTWDHIPMEAVKSKKETKLKIEEFFPGDSLFEEETSLEDPIIPILSEDAKPKMKYVKVNFPPFQHFKYIDGSIILVGKSHWTGSLEDGHFSKDHGAMTRKLAEMFIKLCDRYATRSNWRSYTYNDEMRGQALLQLSQVGLQFDESKSNNPFAFYTTVTTNSFCRILNEEKKRQSLRDDILESYNLNPSFTRQNEWNNYDD
jgi:hypothetical protein